jgi:hypothetical protein
LAAIGYGLTKFGLWLCYGLTVKKVSEKAKESLDKKFDDEEPGVSKAVAKASSSSASFLTGVGGTVVVKNTDTSCNGVGYDPYTVPAPGGGFMPGHNAAAQAPVGVVGYNGPGVSSGKDPLPVPEPQMAYTGSSFSKVEVSGPTLYIGTAAVDKVVPEVTAAMTGGDAQEHRVVLRDTAEATMVVTAVEATATNMSVSGWIESAALAVGNFLMKFPDPF